MVTVEVNEILYTLMCLSFSIHCATLVFKLITRIEKGTEKGGRKQ